MIYDNKVLNSFIKQIKINFIRVFRELFSTKNKDRKVYDCFLFWKEFDVLEIRLNELFSIVDKFIIIESAYTHSGLKKELYLKIILKSLLNLKVK